MKLLRATLLPSKEWFQLALSPARVKEASPQFQSERRLKARSGPLKERNCANYVSQRKDN